jgi:NADPH-dependent glutamate synthase beta subunit-like oxidoreductase/NAD(P)H-flavin reductase
VRERVDETIKTERVSYSHGDQLGDDARGHFVAWLLAAIEAYLVNRRGDAHDTVRSWPSMKSPRTLDFASLVETHRPDAQLPELFVGPGHGRRERDSFQLTDRRGDAREVEEQIDYCLLCHDRDKDSCSKGLRDNKTKEVKKNPLGVLLEGCPLDEKISEMHAMRQRGELLAAMALITIDNPMCAGTGHRICNDCMKACVFQKQEPVNIPQIETRVLSETLALPWGLEIYGFLTRFNPLNVKRPYQRPYRGKNVLVVGLGPAGYTLAHHLASEGFGVVAVDALKIEPLPEELVGAPGTAPTPVRDFQRMYEELDERILLGFGGVSEYGITVRWDKNFLTVLYVTLARERHLRIYGGVRFGGTVTVDDAWRLGFDHIALAAGSGRPTVIDIKNNLARGIRKASDFLMGLQLTGAYKKTSLANLQISLPAVVIGGGLTAIDTATELLAYYLVQIEKEAERVRLLTLERGEAGVRAMFDAEEWTTLDEHLGHARELEREKTQAKAEGRPPRVQDLLSKWGGVSLVYRRRVAESPAYRLNHEEVEKSLEEGVRYLENLSPLEAILDERQAVVAMRFSRKDGSFVDLPAKTVCVAAGTSPNVTYEKEYPGTFKLDEKQQYFQAHTAEIDSSGKLTVAKAERGRGFFTSYAEEGRSVSFYGDNHPVYAGSVVRAMASAKDGYPHVEALFAQSRNLDPFTQAEREDDLSRLFARLDGELVATIRQVNRLTPTIVEVVVHAPLAARKFKPGQFYRLQNFEGGAHMVEGVRLAVEGLALTGAWIDHERGLMGTIVLEMGSSSRLCAALTPGEKCVLMGPTGAPTEVLPREKVILCGGGLGNAVLFSIARAFKMLGSQIVYFAGYKKGEDLFKQGDIEAYADQVIWCTDSGGAIAPRRTHDHYFRGNIVGAMVAWARGELGPQHFRSNDTDRIVAIGSDRMMNGVREARHGVLEPFLNKRHLAIGSINSPMQCMMKEVCAQCLQKHKDPVTGKEHLIFSCFNQDQDLDSVDFEHLNQRLRANSMQEKLSNAVLDLVLKKHPELLKI